MQNATATILMPLRSSVEGRQGVVGKSRGAGKAICKCFVAKALLNWHFHFCPTHTHTHTDKQAYFGPAGSGGIFPSSMGNPAFHI